MYAATHDGDCLDGRGAGGDRGRPEQDYDGGRLREGFTTIHAFWTEKQKSDAAAIAKEALTNLDALDTLLSAPTVDKAAAQAAAKQVQGSCGSCHKLYREGDGKQTPYSIKAGVL